MKCTAQNAERETHEHRKDLLQQVNIACCVKFMKDSTKKTKPELKKAALVLDICFWFTTEAMTRKPVGNPVFKITFHLNLRRFGAKLVIDAVKSLLPKRGLVSHEGV